MDDQTATGAGPEPARDPDTGIFMAGGWCAPSDYLLALPDITVPRGDAPYDHTPRPVPPPPSRRERFRRRRRNLARKFRAARFAAGRAWRNPGGWWDDDGDGWEDD